jgi:hypothetical protein
VNNFRVLMSPGQTLAQSAGHVPLRHHPHDEARNFQSKALLLFIGYVVVAPVLKMMEGSTGM